MRKLVILSLLVTSVAWPRVAMSGTRWVHLDGEYPTEIEHWTVPRPYGWYGTLWLQSGMFPYTREIIEDNTGWLWTSSSQHYEGSVGFGARTTPSTGGSVDRAEIRVVKGETDSFRLTNGQSRYFGYAFKIHPQCDAPDEDSSVIMTQVWQTLNEPSTGKVAFTLRLQHDFSLRADARYVPYDPEFGCDLTQDYPLVHVTEPLEKDTWYKIVLRFKPGIYGDAKVAMWIDDELEFYQSNMSWGNALECGFLDAFDVRCGAYRSQQYTDTILMFDNINYADTYELADPDY